MAMRSVSVLALLASSDAYRTAGCSSLERETFLQYSVDGQKVESGAHLRSGLAALPLDEPDYDTMQVPLGKTPLVSCDAAKYFEGSIENDQLRTAVDTFCDAGLGSFVEFSVDPRFEENHRRLSGADGWMDEAFVSFMGLKDLSDTNAAEEHLLVESIRRFSQKPIMLTNFRNPVPKVLTPEYAPDLVLLHGHNTQDELNRNFFFNKLLAMLFTKVKTGIVLDADQFVSPGVDLFFSRVREETTADYPYPIMPVHWLSMDPEGDDGYPYKYNFAVDVPGAPTRTMRWGHAHPTFTFYALPWLAKWTSYALDPEKAGAPAWLKADQGLQDESLLNVASWASGLTKQWCKFDIPFPGLYDSYVDQKVNGNRFLDSKWYNKGIPLVFITAHAAKNPPESFDWLEKMWSDDAESQIFISYDDKLFRSGEALKEYDPSLKCMI